MKLERKNDIVINIVSIIQITIAFFMFLEIVVGISISSNNNIFDYLLFSIPFIFLISGVNLWNMRKTGLNLTIAVGVLFVILAIIVIIWDFRVNNIINYASFIFIILGIFLSSLYFNKRIKDNMS